MNINEACARASAELLLETDYKDGKISNSQLISLISRAVNRGAMIGLDEATKAVRSYTPPKAAQVAQAIDEAVR